MCPPAPPRQEVPEGPGTAGGGGEAPLTLTTPGKAEGHLPPQVLPPLRDVKTRPEVGKQLRNKLVRLMTHLDTDVKRVAAEFLFVLCSESGEWEPGGLCTPVPPAAWHAHLCPPRSAPFHQVHGLRQRGRPPGCPGPHGRRPARGPVLGGRGHGHRRVQGSQGQVCAPQPWASSLSTCPRSFETCGLGGTA